MLRIAYTLGGKTDELALDFSDTDYCKGTVRRLHQNVLKLIVRESS